MNIEIYRRGTLFATVQGQVEDKGSYVVVREDSYALNIRVLHKACYEARVV